MKPRHLEILNLLAKGLEDSEIGKRLCISKYTVRTHQQHMRAATGTRNRTELVRYGYEHGLIEQPVRGAFA